MIDDARPLWLALGESMRGDLSEDCSTVTNIRTARSDFERDLNNFLLDNCVGMDDHGPGLGPDGCEKCHDMKVRLLRLCELHGFITERIPLTHA